ncbi:MAG: DUF5809 family protein [Haloarculaceae archaeon]
MHTQGSFAPETAAEASERYERLGSTAQVVVREIARAMELDAEEYDRRVTDEVVETAHDALFASSLLVRAGSRTEFAEWCEDRDVEIVEIGSENVDNVAWHHAPFADAVVAATYQGEQQAAVDTLRRQAFGRLYREVLP